MPIWSTEIKELEKLYESFKGQFPELEKELERLIKTDDENIILVYSRRCLEVIITDLCECELKRPRKTEPLKGILDKLNKEEKVPSNIITSMDHLNSLSAYGAHPKDFDPEQVKPVLVNLDIIIKWYLKYKESKINITGKSKDIKDEINAPDDNNGHIHKPKQRLILLLSVLTLVIVTVAVALLVFSIIGGGSRIKELEKSIAVLPFKNDSPDQERMYFINGTMEAILDNLCKIEELRVPGRTTVEQYRDNLKPIPTIAKELDINYILEGSGHRDGNNVRLHVQLLDAGKDKHLWSKTYDADIEEIFSMQSEIAQLIAQEVQAIITPKEQELITQIPTYSTDAYDLYLKGIQGYYDFWNTGDINNVHQSIDFFRNAIELDPDYSFAYTGLGRAYWMLGHYAPDRSPFHWEESKRLLKKAISLDSNNGWAYAELGVVLNNWDWDSTASKNAFEKALLLSPHRPDVYDHYVHLAARMNDCEKLNALMLEIKKRFSPGVDIGLAYFNLKLLTCYQDYEKITKIANLEWNRNTNILQTGYIADAYTILGDFDKAINVAEYMIDSFSNKEYGIAIKGVIQGLEGNIDDAKAALRELELMSESRSISKISLAGISLAIGNVHDARSYLIKALEERDGALHEIVHMAPFYAHRNEPWLKEIIDNSWIPLEISNNNLTGVE